MKKSFVLFLLAGMLLHSCTTYKAFYRIGLSSVESPEVAKKQIGEPKVVNFKEGRYSKCRFEDDYIDIVWHVTARGFNFELKNKSEKFIKLNWDEVSYVDINGRVGRVTHNGVPLLERGASQPMLTIPKGAVLSDILVPTDNIKYESKGSVSWTAKDLIPATYKTVGQYYTYAESNIGKKMTILLPIIVRNTPNYYVFEFIVNELE